MARQTASIISLLFIFYIMAIPLCLATPQLILKVDSKAAELGRPMRAELYGISLSDKLTNINLSALKQNFGIVNEYSNTVWSDKRWPNEETQILRLKLYPKISGEILIPQLSFNARKTTIQKITVSSGKTSAPKIVVSSKTPYERQTFNVFVQLSTPSSTARLSERKNIFQDAASRKPLEFTRTRQPDGTYQLQIGWAFSISKSGDFLLSLPVIEYSESGVLRKLFHLDKTRITARALPSYLPPTMTVGSVLIKSNVTGSGLKSTGTLYYWNIVLQGNILNAYQLPALLRQVKSNKNIMFLPAKTLRDSTVSGESIVTRVTHSIPFKILSSGQQSLPLLDFQYFDPASRKIIASKHKATNLFSLNLFWQVTLYVLLLVLFGMLWIRLRQKWLHFSYLRKKNAEALECLRTHKSIHDIRDAIRLSAEAESWTINMTLAQWADCWRKKYKTDNDFESAVTALSSLFYNTIATNKTAVIEVASQLALIIQFKKRK